MTIVDDFTDDVIEPSQVAAGVSPACRSLLDIFTATVERFGERVALDADDAVLTYRGLWDAAGTLAVELGMAGVGPGDRVGVRVSSGTAQLYASILGVLRSGAAYVPVDADDPAARTQRIWTDAMVCAVIEDGSIVWTSVPPRGGSEQPALDDDAWVIFTSGSTGTPKGVAVTHRSAAAFVDAEARLWTVEPDDRVLAALSVGFDASCEEMWLAWRNGAALVPAPRAIVRSGGDLGPCLVRRGVTVISTVPTLASLWDERVLQGVRLLILGGEACPDELAWRLAAGRELWNTYGPTEATVVSTAARLEPGRPVTIGLPLDGWEVAVIDERGEPVGAGETGELVIAGVGLGRYLDPRLDGERFAPLPAFGFRRAYRTGDIVRNTLDGLQFVARADDQVKLDGRRIELGEVEMHLRAAPAVRAAAAAVQRAGAGNAVLVGYVVGDVDPAAVRAHVTRRLAAGVALQIVVLDALPIRSSGKTDRRALPWPPPAGRSATPADALTGTAAWLAERWADQLGVPPTGPDSDFFELGGSSVMAAKLVSTLRARFPAAAIGDVYKHRRLAELADSLDALDAGRHEPPTSPATPARTWALAQVAGVLLLMAATAPATFGALFAFDDWEHVGVMVPWPWLLAGWLLLVSPPARALLVAVVREALLGRLEPGRYPKHSWLAYRVWFVDRLANSLHLEHLAGTPWSNRLARLLGADVGAGARLATLPSPSGLVSIGAGATIEAGVDAHGWWIEGDEIVIGELRIGDGARIGTRCVLMPGADIGEGAEIEAGSVVSGRVLPGERWTGSPARYVGAAGASWPADAPPRERHRRFWTSMYGAGVLGLRAVPLASAIPALLAFDALHGISPSVSGIVVAAMLSAPLLAAVFVVCEAVVSALAFRAVSRLIRPGWHADEGATAWALWLTGQLTHASNAALFPLYASVYTRAWLRLHGLRVGRRTEVSTTEGLSRLDRLGDTSFVADHPMFAGARTHRGWLHIEPVEVGSRTFVGNGALLTGGTKVGDDSLIGIESNAPRLSADGTSWFGAPPIELPRVPDRPDPSRTTNPPRRLVVARGATEIVRILLPTSVSIVLGALLFVALDATGAAAGGLAIVAVTPFVLTAAAVCAVLVTIAVKWLIIGRYRPGEYPLWSSLVWRDEIVNSCQEQLAGHWLLEKALGSPLLPAYLRAMGARVGRDVWCDTLAITEFDVVHIADGCAINRGACLETHLFHDRLLRIGPTELCTASTLGPVSATLPDTKLGAGCVVGGRSVVMRGEELPPGTRWHGAPLISVSHVARHYDHWMEMTP
jgi:non-ribosomal peptide synthetase-like protein